MYACSFFGHKDCTEKISEKLYNQIESLIVKNDVTKFYVPTQMNFDVLAYKLLLKLKEKYPNIKVYRVLDYMPEFGEKIPDSVVPDGIEFVQPRFAVLWRNRWMLNKSDYVIAYVTEDSGCAVKL